MSKPAPQLSDHMSAALADMRASGGLKWNGALWCGEHKHGESTVRGLIRRGLAREEQGGKVEAIKRGKHGAKS